MPAKPSPASAAGGPDAASPRTPARDLDLIRDLLARTAEGEFNSSDPVVIHHGSLMKKDGLIDAVITPHQWRDRFALAIFKRLTPAGRAFLRGSENASVWRQAKREFDRPGIIFSLAVIGDYLRRGGETGANSEIAAR